MIGDKDVAARIHGEAIGRRESAAYQDDGGRQRNLPGDGHNLLDCGPVRYEDIATCVHRNAVDVAEPALDRNRGRGRRYLAIHCHDLFHRFVAVVGDEDVALGVHCHAVRETEPTSRSAGRSGETHRLRGHWGSRGQNEKKNNAIAARANEKIVARSASARSLFKLIAATG